MSFINHTPNCESFLNSESIKDRVLIKTWNVVFGSDFNLHLYSFRSQPSMVSDVSERIRTVNFFEDFLIFLFFGWIISNTTYPTSYVRGVCWWVGSYVCLQGTVSGRVIRIKKTKDPDVDVIKGRRTESGQGRLSYTLARTVSG